MREEYAVYKYTCKDTGKVVYIGKTNRSLKQRVDAHKREKPFEAYDCDIEYAVLSNSVETDAVEKMLINYYKPILNDKDNVPFLTDSLTIPTLRWIPYQIYKPSLDLINQVTKQYKETLDIAFMLYPDKETYISDIPISGLIPFRNQTICLFGPYCEYKDGKFVYSVDNEVLDLIIENEKEILWNIYKDIPLFMKLSDIREKQFKDMLKYPAMIGVIEDFIYNGYQYGEYNEPYELIIEDSLPKALIDIFENNFNTKLTERNGYYICEFGREQGDLLPAFRKKIYTCVLNWLEANNYAKVR